MNFHVGQKCVVISTPQKIHKNLIGINIIIHHWPQENELVTIRRLMTCRATGFFLAFFNEYVIATYPNGYELGLNVKFIRPLDDLYNTEIAELTEVLKEPVKA